MESPFKKKVSPMAVITISREIYSNGDHIGEKVAEALGYHFIDKATIEKVFAEHSIVQFREVYNTVLGFWERFDDMRITTMRFLKQVIQALAHHGNMVIVGRGAFAVLGGYADALHVRVQAPFAVRAQRLMDREKVKELNRAKELLRERDRARDYFIKSFFNVWRHEMAADAFDLVVDTGKIPTDLAVRWLVEALTVLKESKVQDQPTTDTIAVDPVLVDTVSKILLKN
jgi:cytidylate kinase